MEILSTRPQGLSVEARHTLSLEVAKQRRLRVATSSSLFLPRNIVTFTSKLTDKDKLTMNFRSLRSAKRKDKKKTGTDSLSASDVTNFHPGSSSAFCPENNSRVLLPTKEQTHEDILKERNIPENETSNEIELIMEVPDEEATRLFVSPEDFRRICNNMSDNDNQATLQTTPESSSNISETFNTDKVEVILDVRDEEEATRLFISTEEFKRIYEKYSHSNVQAVEAVQEQDITSPNDYQGQGTTERQKSTAEQQNYPAPNFLVPENQNLYMEHPQARISSVRLGVRPFAAQTALLPTRGTSSLQNLPTNPSAVQQFSSNHSPVPLQQCSARNSPPVRKPRPRKTKIHQPAQQVPPMMHNMTLQEQLEQQMPQKYTSNQGQIPYAGIYQPQQHQEFPTNSPAYRRPPPYPQHYPGFYQPPAMQGHSNHNAELQHHHNDIPVSAPPSHINPDIRYRPYQDFQRPACSYHMQPQAQSEQPTVAPPDNLTSSYPKPSTQVDTSNWMTPRYPPQYNQIPSQRQALLSLSASNHLYAFYERLRELHEAGFGFSMVPPYWSGNPMAAIDLAINLLHGTGNPEMHAPHGPVTMGRIQGLNHFVQQPSQSMQHPSPRVHPDSTTGGNTQASPRGMFIRNGVNFNPRNT